LPHWTYSNMDTFNTAVLNPACSHILSLTVGLLHSNVKAGVVAIYKYLEDLSIAIIKL
jgi:hypothetical protein